MGTQKDENLFPSLSSPTFTCNAQKPEKLEQLVQPKQSYQKQQQQQQKPEQLQQGKQRKQQEPVLLVPIRQTRSAYAILLNAGWNIVPRRWHLEGRFGSRTHQYHAIEEEDGVKDENDRRNSSSSTSKLSSIQPPLRRSALPILHSAAPILISFLSDVRCERALLEEGTLIVDETKTVTTTVHGEDKNNGNKIDERAIMTKDLKDLLRTEGVDIIYKDVVKATNAPKIEEIDATVHPEKRRGGIPIILPTNTATSTPPPFTFCELFAGIGGFGLALERLGGRCVFASEIDPACQNMYTLNMKSMKDDGALLHGDICEISVDEIPYHDILVGGFPCQTFSSSGQMNGINDPSGRGMLYQQVVKILKSANKPRAFLLENVPGLKCCVTSNTNLSESSNTDGNKSPKNVKHVSKDYDIIMKDLSCGGSYEVCTEVISSRCLTAQSRKRLFFVGLLKVGESNHYPFEFPYIPDLGLRAGDILQYQHLDEDKNNDDDVDNYDNYNEEHSETDNTLNHQELQLHLTDEQMNRLCERRRWKPGSDLAWPNSVCGTLTSHYGVTVSKGNSQMIPSSAAATSLSASFFPFSSNPRLFSPRECSMLMGFPKSFVLPQYNNFCSKYKLDVEEGTTEGTNHPSCDNEHEISINSSKIIIKPVLRDGYDDNDDQHVPYSCHTRGVRAFRKEQYRMLGNAVCPPIVAVLSSAVLNRIVPFPDAINDSIDCDGKNKPRVKYGEEIGVHMDWITYGLDVAIQIALEAVKSTNRKNEIIAKNRRMLWRGK